MAAPTALTDADREELRLLYQVTAADIAFFKQQQWTISNYALAIQDAWRVPKEPDDFRWLLVLVLILSASIATWLILVRPK